MADWRSGGLSILHDRVEQSIAALNDGDFEPLLSGYSDDVQVRIPFYREGDPVGPPTLKGKASWRSYMLQYMLRHGAITLVSVEPISRGMVVTLRDSRGEPLTLSVELNESGLGIMVVVFIV
ncbi:hypothetical protein JNW90_26595 [Micromonospora sp. STR1s_5]|nr:hypothetical protein [Micromonospora sp. STR1s_5]